MPPVINKTRPYDKSSLSIPEDGKQDHGPIFPFRFACEPSYLENPTRPRLQHHEPFSRWSIEKSRPPRALEWSDSGKGKSPTALADDEPDRCCKICTPSLVLLERIDSITGIQTPGGVYVGLLAGGGWYSSPQGTEFLVRLVTSSDEIVELRKEAVVYETYEALYSSRKADHGGKIPPLEFHGFFQSDSGNSAAIILRCSNPLVNYM
ncbi:hypothetical protein M422DRAFT_68769 [Sphaerobolus stellatus SS14]|uniref:Uncharacterized protein n=1 Tax=Sphaerobolus stellatus (strain SS14) TaxID=990650 RepID=A0A0C9U8S2_SPHS4|nr:hypothetical protein M422DRAFT_68769 [Sphaerobolus stellatus SS14]